MFDEDEFYRINAFDWQTEFAGIMQDGGFDAVIGNPPYIRIQAMKEWAPKEVEFYKECYIAASKGNYDIYVVFVEKGLDLLNKQGRLGFILPHKFFNAKYGGPLRGVLAEGNHLSDIVHFGDQQVFAKATTYTCLLFLDKQARDSFHFVKAHDLSAWRLGKDQLEGDVSASKVIMSEWNFIVGPGAKLYERLNQMPEKLGAVASIFVGLQTSADKIYIVEELDQSNQKLIKIRDQNGTEWMLEREILKPFLYRVTVSTFEQPTSKHWLIFPYYMNNGQAVLIPAKEISSNYPNVWNYLTEYSKALRGRESGKVDNERWYGYIYRKNLTLFDAPKLIVQVISLFGRYAYDDTRLYFTGGGNGPYYGVRWLDTTNNPHSLYYLQALLNSSLLDFYLHQISSPFRGGYWSYGKRSHGTKMVLESPVLTSIQYHFGLEF